MGWPWAWRSHRWLRLQPDDGATPRHAVASTTWTTNTGSSGTAAGTTSWTVSIPVLVGSNQVVLTAADTSGNTAWRSVVVSRN
jgi:hypothetical protein